MLQAIYFSQFRYKCTAIWRNLSAYYIVTGMRLHLSLLLVLSSQLAFGQADSAGRREHTPICPFGKNSVTAAVSVGFVDHYRNSYSLPAGFEKQNTSGFLPVYARIEYAFANHWSIAGVFSYDDFNYNFFQLYKGYNGDIRRPVVSHFTLYAGGAQAVYHHPFEAVPKLDPFIAAGVSVNITRDSKFPQGDSTIVRTLHTTSPSIRVGARYYLTNTFSFYGDVGYDELSVCSLGMSVRFNSRKVLPSVIKCE